jgi:hypothetical protein
MLVHGAILICLIHLHGTVLNEASTGITLHFTFYFQTTEINIYMFQQAGDVPLK